MSKTILAGQGCVVRFDPEAGQSSDVQGLGTDNLRSCVCVWLKSTLNGKVSLAHVDSKTNSENGFIRELKWLVGDDWKDHKDKIEVHLVYNSEKYDVGGDEDPSPLLNALKDTFDRLELGKCFSDPSFNGVCLLTIKYLEGTSTSTVTGLAKKQKKQLLKGGWVKDCRLIESERFGRASATIRPLVLLNSIFSGKDGSTLLITYDEGQWVKNPVQPIRKVSDLISNYNKAGEDEARGLLSSEANALAEKEGRTAVDVITALFNKLEELLGDLNGAGYRLPTEAAVSAIDDEVTSSYSLSCGSK